MAPPDVNHVGCSKTVDAIVKSLKWLIPFCFGLAAGCAIAWIDNVAFQGEVSPIVIVVILFIAAFIAMLVWGRQGWVAAAATWVLVPSAHLAKHILGMSDTLHPNTYTSIAKLAAFTLFITAFGAAAGFMIHIHNPPSEW